MSGGGVMNVQFVLCQKLENSQTKIKMGKKILNIYTQPHNIYVVSNTFSDILSSSIYIHKYLVWVVCVFWWVWGRGD